MVPIDHSRLHARDFGGKPEDYLPIDNFLDQTKFALADDGRHRAFLHNPTGIAIVERLFGATIRNSVGCEIPTRELARRHIMQDCGRVPTLREWVEALEKQSNPFNAPNKADLKWLRENYYEAKEPECQNV